jgi:chaperonin GroEL
MALEDLSILAGGQPIIRAGGQTLAAVHLTNLGRARRAWASAEFFGIVGGKGDPRHLREHLIQLREAFAQAKTLSARQALQQRIGKLMGGTATLWVGENTESAIKRRVESATRAAAALRSALRDGVIPGGGTALLNCKAALQQRLASVTDEDERAAYNIVLRALDKPLHVMLSNAGFDPIQIGAIAGEIDRQGRGYGFDLRSSRVSPMIKVGVYDSTGVVKAAVRHALATAALALTVDVLVHSKNPVAAAKP